ncbi:MAG: hypothetical protein IJW08_09250 [Lentisphaeria bacterium]|nr:hypothetical protein [Lentisphaeria bacterium]MBR7120438.1 hypothetical protein [Lentisphaeria bacterium]
MKKSIISAAAAALVAFTGCTTVESTQKFNAVQLGTPDEKHICQTHVEIPGYFFLGLPLVVGSAKGDGQTAFFRFNLTTENAMYLLTREVKSKGASRLINVHVQTTEQPMLIPFMSYRTIQASGTGVGSRRAALRNAESAYDAR